MAMPTALPMAMPMALPTAMPMAIPVACGNAYDNAHGKTYFAQQCADLLAKLKFNFCSFKASVRVDRCPRVAMRRAVLRSLASQIQHLVAGAAKFRIFSFTASARVGQSCRSIGRRRLIQAEVQQGNVVETRYDSMIGKIYTYHFESNCFLPVRWSIFDESSMSATPGT